MSDFPPSKTFRRDNITQYRERPAITPESTGLNTTFVFDHTTQRKVVPKAAARGGAQFGTRTMNSGGAPAGPVNGDLSED